MKGLKQPMIFHHLKLTKAPERQGTTQWFGFGIDWGRGVAVACWTNWGRGVAVACWTDWGRGNQPLEVEARYQILNPPIFLLIFDKFYQNLLNFK
jgi:hypothetical protein